MNIPSLSILETIFSADHGKIANKRSLVSHVAINSVVEQVDNKSVENNLAWIDIVLQKFYIDFFL